MNRHCLEQTVVLATNRPIAEEHFQAIPEVETVMHIDLRFTIRVRVTIVQVNGVAWLPRCTCIGSRTF